MKIQLVTVSYPPGCCCYWSYSFCWLLHPWNLHYPDSDSLPGAKTSGSYWSQGCPPASHRNLHVSLPTYYCVTPTFLGTPWTWPSRATTRERPQWGWCGGCSPGKFCTCVAPSLMSTHWRSCLISASTEILKRLKGKSRRHLRRQWPMRSFRVNAPLQPWGVLSLR